jgi:hypothetical protein
MKHMNIFKLFLIIMEEFGNIFKDGHVKFFKKCVERNNLLKYHFLPQEKYRILYSK